MRVLHEYVFFKICVPRAGVLPSRRAERERETEQHGRGARILLGLLRSMPGVAARDTLAGGLTAAHRQQFVDEGFCVVAGAFSHMECDELVERQTALREGATAVRGHARELEQLLTQHGCVPSQDWPSKLTIKIDYPLGEPSHSRPCLPRQKRPFLSVSERF